MSEDKKKKVEKKAEDQGMTKYAVAPDTLTKEATVMDTDADDDKKPD